MYPVSLGSAAKKAWLLMFSTKQTRALSLNDICYPDYSYGVMRSGHLNERIMGTFLSNIREGINDITCHPGYAPRDNKYLRWNYCWETELQVFANEDWKNIANSLNIKLINYAR